MIKLTRCDHLGRPDLLTWPLKIGEHFPAELQQEQKVDILAHHGGPNNLKQILRYV